MRNHKPFLEYWIEQDSKAIVRLTSELLRLDDDPLWCHKRKAAMLRNRLIERAKMMTELERLKHARDI